MSRLLRAVLCDNWSQTSGKNNLIGIFDRWTVPGLPFFCPQFCLNALVEATKGPHSFKIQVANEQDQPLGPPQEIPFICDSSSVPHTVNMTYSAFVLTKPGMTRFMLHIDDEFVGEATFIVVTPKKTAEEVPQ